MAELTVITITKNEESNIVDCLSSVRWADQIIVIDSGSTDKTVELAQGFTSDVHTIVWEGYGAARNYALGCARGAWVLWLDADERVPADLAQEIRDVIRANDPAYNGFSVPRKAFFLGRWIRHCGWYPSRVTRLFRKSCGKFGSQRVHEQLDVQGNVGQLQHDLLHFTDRDLRQYFTKFNRYTSLAAEDLASLGRSASGWDLLFRPPFMFVKMYLLRRGFLDGLHGFILSTLSSAYVFTKYAKLWELTRKQTSGRE